MGLGITDDGQVVGEEMLVSGSDDFTLFLWKPGSEKTPVARMTGGWIGGTEQHQHTNVQLSKCPNIQMCILN